ncbi:MAG: hypothetical protein HY391_05010 [Deltaproteobacteria bacterium]|nr:hypothetical protein [Deltaproteobacteria bacterium]
MEHKRETQRKDSRKATQDLIRLLAILLLIAGCAQEREKKIKYDYTEIKVPQTWLDGEFHYSITLSDITYHSATDFPGLWTSTLVKTRRRSDRLDFIDLESGLQRPEKGDDHEKGDVHPISSIEIDPVDEVEDKDQNEEETGDIILERRRSPLERSFAIIKFGENDMDEIGLLPFKDLSASKCYEPSNYTRVFNVEVTENSINYFIEKVYQRSAACQSETGYSDSFKAVFHHSLLRTIENKAFKPKPYPIGDQEKVGLFSVAPANFKAGNQKKDFDFYSARWDPSRKIVYFFSSNFPESLKPGVRKIVANVNQHLKKIVGHDMLEVQDGTGKETMGDLRYNTINWIDQATDGICGLAGMDIDPRTGEAVHGRVFLYKSCFDAELERFLELSRITPIHYEQEGNPNWPASGKKLSPNLLFSKSLVPSKEGGKGVFNAFIANLEERRTRSLKKESVSFLAQHRKDEKELQKAYREHNVCGGMSEKALAKVAAAFAGAGVAGSSFNKEAMWQRMVLATFIHEFLHSLGLGHNFEGSFDKKYHFSAEADFPELPKPVRDKLLPGGKVRSSTVMEYMPDLMMPLTLGPYDKFALSYNYGENSAELAAKSDFLYCSNAEMDSGTNPFCNVWDIGISATEIAKDIVEDYQIQYAMRNFRNDWNQYEKFARNDIDSALDYASGIISNYIEPLLQWIRYRPWREWLEKTGQVPTTMDNTLRADLKEVGKITMNFFEKILQDGDRRFYDHVNLKNELFVRGIELDKWAVTWRSFTSQNFLEEDSIIRGHYGDIRTGLFQAMPQETKALLRQIATNRLIGKDGSLTTKAFFPDHPTLSLRLTAIFQAIYGTGVRDFEADVADELRTELAIETFYDWKFDENKEVSSNAIDGEKFAAKKGTIAADMIVIFNQLDDKYRALETFEMGMQEIATTREALEKLWNQFDAKKNDPSYHLKELNPNIEKLIELAERMNIAPDDQDQKKVLSEISRALKAIEKLNKDEGIDTMSTLSYGSEGNQKNYLELIEKTYWPVLSVLIEKMRGVSIESLRPRYLSMLKEEGLIAANASETVLDTKEKLKEKLQILKEKVARPRKEMGFTVYNVVKFGLSNRVVSPAEISLGL